MRKGLNMFHAESIFKSSSTDSMSHGKIGHASVLASAGVLTAYHILGYSLFSPYLYFIYHRFFVLFLQFIDSIRNLQIETIDSLKSSGALCTLVDRTPRGMS